MGQLPATNSQILARIPFDAGNTTTTTHNVIPFTTRPVEALDETVVSTLTDTFTKKGHLNYLESSSSSPPPLIVDIPPLSLVEAQVWECRFVKSEPSMPVPPIPAASVHPLDDDTVEGSGAFVPAKDLFIVRGNEVIRVERISDSPVCSTTLLLNELMN